MGATGGVEADSKSRRLARAIDCDAHVEPPDTSVLLPYLDAYWREAVTGRGIDRSNLSLVSYPPNVPLSARPDWRPERGRPGSDPALLQRALLDAFGLDIAILNCVHAAQAFPSEDMSAALCRAVNDWIAAEWLDRDPRLRASILVPLRGPELAVAEIERRAHDRRFVQILVPVMGDMPLGRRIYWPVWAAAERHGLPVGIHAGSVYRTAPTSIGWPSHYIEDMAAQCQAFESQVLSLLAEGAFRRFPRLRVVLMEAGWTWLPGFLWRADKTWRGVRPEVPWLDRAPSAVLREHLRVTLQPVDEPPDPAELDRVVRQIGSDRMLLFSTDFPHWHFDGMAALPEGLPEAMLPRLLRDNALETYPRLQPAEAPA